VAVWWCVRVCVCVRVYVCWWWWYLCGALAFWRSGALALWCSGALALRRSGAGAGTGTARVGGVVAWCHAVVAPTCFVMSRHRAGATVVRHAGPHVRYRAGRAWRPPLRPLACKPCWFLGLEAWPSGLPHESLSNEPVLGCWVFLFYTATWGNVEQWGGRLPCAAKCCRLLAVLCCLCRRRLLDHDRSAPVLRARRFVTA